MKPVKVKTLHVAIAIYAISLASIFVGTKMAYGAEEIPSEFYMNYTPDVQLVLEIDQCDKSDISKGWSAYALELSTNRKATGCWLYSQEETVTIHISIGADSETGAERFLDYRLFKSKFKPRYN